MEANEHPIFVSMDSEQQFPQLFSNALETPSTADSQKQDTQILRCKEDDKEIESETCPPQETSETEDSKPEVSQHRRMKCPECLRYSAETEEKLMRHIRKVHRGENPFQCYMCDYSTYNNVRFDEHVRKHQGIKPFKCTNCDYSSASRKNLKKHEFKHRPDYPLKCTECDFIGQHRSALLAHQRTHSEANPIKDEPGLVERNFSCKTCFTKFESPETLRSHNKSKKKCIDCKAVLCTKKLLTLHIKVYHKELVKKAKKKRSARAQLFKCQLCEWSSSHKPKILLHLIHHPNQSVDENVIDISILRRHGIMA